MSHIPMVTVTFSSSIQQCCRMRVETNDFGSASSRNIKTMEHPIGQIFVLSFRRRRLPSWPLTLKRGVQSLSTHLFGQEPEPTMNIAAPSHFISVLTVMVDYGNAPFLWLIDTPDQGGIGGNIGNAAGWDDLCPMSQGLWRKFADWAIAFDRTCYVHRNPRHKPPATSRVLLAND